MRLLFLGAAFEASARAGLLDVAVEPEAPVDRAAGAAPVSRRLAGRSTDPEAAAPGVELLSASFALRLGARSVSVKALALDLGWEVGVSLRIIFRVDFGAALPAVRLSGVFAAEVLVEARNSSMSEALMGGEEARGEGLMGELDLRWWLNVFCIAGALLVSPVLPETDPVAGFDWAVLRVLSVFAAAGATDFEAATFDLASAVAGFFAGSDFFSGSNRFGGTFGSRLGGTFGSRFGAGFWLASRESAGFETVFLSNVLAGGLTSSFAVVFAGVEAEEREAPTRGTADGAGCPTHRPDRVARPVGPRRADETVPCSGPPLRGPAGAQRTRCRLTQHRWAE